VDRDGQAVRILSAHARDTVLRARNTARVVAAVILIGAPGAGKSSVLEALATLHDIEDVEHGAIEAEQLSLGRPLLRASRWVPQLEAVLSLQREAGRRRFLVSATVVSAEDLAAVRNATAAELALVVCLSASCETVAARIEAREPDRWPGKLALIERARKLASSTPGLPGVDLVINTEQRAAQDVAAEIFAAMRSRGML
jgi:chloramphenicol 3-O-phosphotransferase